MSTHPVYADLGALKAVVGNPAGQDDRLHIALVMASRWVDRTIGRNAADAEVPIDATPVDVPVSIDVVPVDIGIRNATVVAAARFLRSPDIPFGAAGGLGDLAVYVKADIPEAEAHLLGLRTKWGVA